MNSERAKFFERKFLLSSSSELERMILMLRNVPLDPVRPLEGLVREEVRKRGLDQNAYYWIRVGEIADQAWFEGKQYDADTWHEFLKRYAMPDIITTKDGVERSKWIEMPYGNLRVISTTQLERKCFANYCQMIEAFGVTECAVKFSANPRDYLGN